MAGPGRRARAAGGRPHQVSVLFSTAEWEAVRAAADGAGLAARAWVGEVSVAAANAASSSGAGGLPARELVVALSELTEMRRVLRNVGGNLNDVARHANSTGEVAEETVAVERLVARVVRSVDDAVARVDAVARQAAAARARPGSRAARPVAVSSRPAADGHMGRAGGQGDGRAAGQRGTAGGGW